MPRNINQAGLSLLKSCEGCRLSVYLDVAGNPTVGYGHLCPNLPVGTHITQDQADAFLAQDLEHVEAAIECMVNVPLTDNQFSALCSLVFNIGSGHFKESTCLSLLNEKRYEEAADWILPWDKAGGYVVEALQDRRVAERALFLKPDND